MPFGLDQETFEKIKSVFQSHIEVEKVILYGSRVKGAFKKGSDIDISLKGENIDLRKLNRISEELDELQLPYIFDISIFHKIENEDMINHIKRVGEVIYEKMEDKGFT